MSAFVLIAVLLTLAAVAALSYPLLRKRSGETSAWMPAGIATLVVAGGAAALYPVWSNWKWNDPMPAADSPAAMVGRLARRLEKQPNDLNGWLLLGRSYGVIEQYNLSARAYQRANTLADGKNVDALLGLGDALINGGQSDFGGRAGRLFEQALEHDPKSVRALFFSAIAAGERNEIPLARSRYVRLLDANPPAEIKKLIEEQVRALDGLSTMVAATPAGPNAAGSAAVQTAPAAAVVAVPVRITLSANVAKNAAAGAPLFVLARVPGQRGPPLAARRLEAKFPQDVDLLSSDAMIAGTGFIAGQELEITARIANGGSAMSKSGDPMGSVVLKAGGKTRAAIEINQLTP
jgi:cytochrome c-type biogenesis protein CcmH